jgi:hypothetical protein
MAVATTLSRASLVVNPIHGADSCTATNETACSADDNCVWCAGGCFVSQYSTCCNTLAPTKHQCGGTNAVLCPGLRGVMCMDFNSTADCVDFGCCEYGMRLCGPHCFSESESRCCERRGEYHVVLNNQTC